MARRIQSVVALHRACASGILELVEVDGVRSGKSHRVYLLAAEYGPAPEAAPGKKARPPILPDSFHILVVGK